MTQVGDLVDGRGVYLGEWKVGTGDFMHAYVTEDFLRNHDGKKLILNFDEANKELTTQNNERESLTKTHYCDGELVLPPKELLHGKDVYGKATREANIYALVEAGKLPKVAEALQQEEHSGEQDQFWALSSSQHPVDSSRVYHFKLAGTAIGNWSDKIEERAGVLPVRFFRNAPPTPGG